jgi:hypothetical protein
VLIRTADLTQVKHYADEYSQFCLTDLWLISLPSGVVSGPDDVNCDRTDEIGFVLQHK